jgi:hypothetical protein
MGVAILGTRTAAAARIASQQLTDRYVTRRYRRYRVDIRVYGKETGLGFLQSVVLFVLGNTWLMGILMPNAIFFTNESRGKWKPPISKVQRLQSSRELCLPKFQISYRNWSARPKGHEHA